MDEQPRFDLPRFFGQLKRRRVIRVAGVYIVAGFAVIQGANAVLEMAGAPDWIGKLVLALVALAFPAALALAWAFDVTPEGVVRTPPEPGPPGRSRSRPRQVAVVGAVTVVALVATVWLTRDRAGATELDADTVMVLPFQISADPSLDHLREGMVVLLAASLNGEADSRAVDPRTAMVAWQRAATREGEDLSPDRALEVARAVGAGRLLLGGAVGTPAALTLNAELYDVGRGEIRTRVSRTGPADSLPALVDGIVAHLLAREAAVPQHQLEAMMTTSLPALRAYLDGYRSYRIGRFAEAAEQLEEALRQDSTFALAAIQLRLASGWGSHTAAPGTGDRALRLAWAERDRLSSPDRLFLEALAGPRYPEPTPRLELRAARERALDASPDRPEALYLVAWFHRTGIPLGEDGARERAREYYLRALEHDSTFAPALFPIARDAALDHDSATVRLLASRYLAADSTSETAELLRWLAAAASGNERAILDVHARIPSMHPTALVWIAEHAMTSGLDLEGAEAALAALRAGARSQRERFLQFEPEIEFLANRGRLNEARAIYDSTLRAAGPGPGSPISADDDEAGRHAGIPSLALSQNQFMLARTFDALGDPAAGLRVIRRRAGPLPIFLASALREEGRLAARAGDREGAIRAYRHYLALRTQPDPELEDEVRAVREELAALEGEGR